MYILQNVHLYKVVLLHISNVYKNIVVKRIIENINISSRLTPLHFVYVPVPCQRSERSCICMLEESILPLSTVFLDAFWKCSDVVILFVCHFY